MIRNLISKEAIAGMIVVFVATVITMLVISLPSSGEVENEGHVHDLTGLIIDGPPGNTIRLSMAYGEVLEAVGLTTISAKCGCVVWQRELPTPSFSNNMEVIAADFEVVPRCVLCSKPTEPRPIEHLNETEMLMAEFCPSCNVFTMNAEVEKYIEEQDKKGQGE